MGKLPWVDALSSGGLHQTGKDAVGFQSAFRSCSEAYLTEDDQVPEGLFRVIVGGRYAGAPEERKEEFLFGSCEITPEDLGGFEAKKGEKGDVGSEATYKKWRGSGISSEFAARFTAEVVTPKYRATSAPGYPIFFTVN